MGLVQWSLRSVMAAAMCVLFAVEAGNAAELTAQLPRERINIDKDWRFALGHAQDAKKDFGYGTAAFFFGKAGYGDGPASAKFDDRAWRKLDLPHDWAVELPFDRRASTNHGSHAVGAAFPENSIGWYRKRIFIPESDKGRRIAVEFDGVYRNSTVWFNGHYIGTEHSGYSSFRYDLTDYVLYGKPNLLVVRADASVEEGWFYEGAGIYRHVWLTKTNPLHVAHWGTYVASAVDGANATVTVRTSVDNEDQSAQNFTIEQQIVDAEGHAVADATGPSQSLEAGLSSDYEQSLTIADAKLWSIDTPNLYCLITTIRSGVTPVDRYQTNFGVRTVRWDPATGFWLNGQNIKIKGTNNHQDHAGVGVALPDGLQEYRLRRLKAMGSNAYRTAHHPPTPELLDAADRLGMLVLDENRLMGTTPEIKDQLTGLIRRDRNHPSVVIWSVGNEEWALEGNDMGARFTKLMQDIVRKLDSTRRATVAVSGGLGSLSTTDVAGFNYRGQHDIDGFHRAHPDTPAVMTEEGSTAASRGSYVTDNKAMHIAAYDMPMPPRYSATLQQGWNAVVDRPWMSGMFVWAGFDYRGETTPFGWPAVSSQFGVLDTTGAFKDNAYLVKSWWTDAPMVHILPHWNWPKRIGQTIPVWVYANADEVELFLNGASLGRQQMKPNSHLEWQVAYHPGTLLAKGYRAGREIASDRVDTTGPEKTLTLQADHDAAVSDGNDVTVVAVGALDSEGRHVPTANDDVSFAISGPARIIGVGNGDPASHEADRFVDSFAVVQVGGWQMAPLDPRNASRPLANKAKLKWSNPFQWYPPGTEPPTPPAFVLRGSFAAMKISGKVQRKLFLLQLTERQRVFVAGKDLTNRVMRDDQGLSVPLDGAAPSKGATDVLIVISSDVDTALKALKSIDPNLASVQYRTPASAWKRHLFNGYAQVLVQTTGGTEPATLTAMSPGLIPAQLMLQPVAAR